MRHLSIFFFLMASFWSTAQTTVQGIVTDSTGTPLSGASVLLLQKADSVLARFAITEPNGQFELPDASGGDYWLRITYVGYESFTQPLQLKPRQPVNLEQIILQQKVEELESVVVEAERAPIAIRGDTIQYNADAFQTRPNAAVEDLLKRLPGVEVDRNGNIKAQGKDVDRVLVDGKEFFGDDPKLATQNLPADIVDKVQVYDRKSEKAEFTGVDDGQRNTTINLGLKEDKKKGYFGTLEAGHGTSDRFATKGNVNRFTDDYQLSALGRFNNINQQGFSIQDYFNLMGGIQNLMSNGTLTINPSDLGIDIDGDGRSSGLATTAAGGLNLNYDLSKQTELSVNYFLNRTDRNLDQQTERQYFQGGSSTFQTREAEDRNALNTNHRINSRLKFEIDSTQDLQLRANFGFNNLSLSSESLRETLGGEETARNTMDRTYQSGNQQYNLDARAVYRRKLGQTGRALVAEASYGTRNGNGQSDLASVSRFPLNLLTDSLFQEQLNEQQRANYQAEVSYTEPLGKGHFLELSYERQNYREASARDFFDLMHGQPLFNDALSNRFSSDYTYDQAILRLQRNRKNYNLSVGLAAQEARLEGQLQSEQSHLQRRFSNFLPNLNGRYEFTNTKSISLQYQTQVQEPSVDQLQPIVDNSDPLNLYTGNPNLLPEYRHNLRLQTLLYDPFSFTSFFAMINAVYTRNRITQSTTIDEELRQVIQPVNVDNDYFLFGSLSFGTPLRFIKSRMELSMEGNYNRSFLPLNGETQAVDRWNGTFSLTLENRKKERVDLLGGVEWRVQETVYAADATLNQRFNSQSYFLEGQLSLGDRWQLSSRFDYQVFPQGPFAERQDFPLWEASVSWFAGAKKQLEIRLSGFDLLDRNLGISRNAAFNYIENSRMGALGQYFMLSAVYNLKGFGQ